MTFIINFKAKNATDYANQKFEENNDAESFMEMITENGGQAWIVD